MNSLQIQFKRLRNQSVFGIEWGSNVTLGKVFWSSEDLTLCIFFSNYMFNDVTLVAQNQPQ